jgi:enoyl-CoA hydratase/carnithine racemase
MVYQEIRYEVDDRVATITLDRPEKLNAWTLRLGAEVRHAMLGAEHDDTVRVIVVTGAGKGYCAGADMDMLQGLQRGGGTDGRFDDLEVAIDRDLPAAFRGEYSYPLGLTKPVIAAVNGVAAGLGVSYMLYYDIRIASDRARFGFMFPRRGLIAEHGSAWILPRLVGMAHACDLLFTGRLIDAQEALSIGLVNRVVPHDTLLGHVREYAQQLAAQSSPRSLRIMKRQLYTNQFVDLEASIREADAEMVACFSTHDFREGVASFVEKRAPRFTGR